MCDQFDQHSAKNINWMILGSKKEWSNQEINFEKSAIT